MGLRRTNIYLTDNEVKELGAIAKQTGISVAELIRRILDDWLERQKRKSRS
jgi:predicted DNA-binding ribbon-helix-helix protein